MFELLGLGWLLFWGFIGLIMAVASGYIAANKGRNPWAYFFLGLILWPLALTLALLVAEGTGGDYRKCPFCAEPMKREAITCKHCGRDIPSPRPSAGPQ